MEAGITLGQLSSREKGTLDLSRSQVIPRAEVGAMRNGLPAGYSNLSLLLKRTITHDHYSNLPPLKGASPAELCSLFSPAQDVVSLSFLC